LTLCNDFQQEVLAIANVRMDEKTCALLREVGAWRNQPISEVIAEAVDRLWREELLKRANASYARLREEPEAWEDLLRERAEWDVTLLDGLKDD